MFNEQVQSTRDVQRETTRSSVLASAQKLFRRDGFRRTTVRTIAADAGVSVGTVMGVGDKDALLLDCFDSWIADGHDRRAGPGRRLSPVERLGETIAPFVELFAADEGLAREYAGVLVRGAHRPEVFAGLGLALRAEFEAVVRAVGVDDAPAVAEVLYLTYLGLLFATSSTGGPASDVRTRFEAAAVTVLNSQGGKDV